MLLDNSLNIFSKKNIFLKKVSLFNNNFSPSSIKFFKKKRKKDREIGKIKFLEIRFC